ncbi:MAG: T9SS type A sorting domain-containing protein [Candidatus Eisenbacteria bacterium]|nr:T9SS type A sorting domain-containing protein [Candidatus Eisenbacteria bacterium]
MPRASRLLRLGLPIACALFACALAGPVHAGELAWEWTQGPEGAWMTCFLTTPQGTILAGADNGGLFRSTDGGESWSSIEVPWPCCNYHVPSLAAAATSVYVGTWGGGVYRSDDDGLNWYATGTIPDEGYPIILGLVACKFGERLYAGGQFGVVRSDDGGASWEQAGTGLPDLQSNWMKGLALHGTVLFALLDHDIYRLDPDARTWSVWEDGLPSLFGMQSIRASEDAVYLSAHEGGVYVLDCGDSTWVPWNAGLYDDNVDATIDAGEALYAGLMGGGAYRYDWPQQQWVQWNAGLWNWDVRVMGSRGTRALAGCFGAGVFRLDPESDVWEWSSTGMAAPLMSAIVADGSFVYAAGNGAGVHVSTDAGASWNVAVDGLGDYAVMSLGRVGSDIYAGTWIGVWKSTDHAQSWQAAGLQNQGIFALENFDGALYAGSFEGKVWRSDDGGDSWDEVGTGLPSNMVQSVARGDDALYVATQSEGVFVLHDGQSVWSAMNAGLLVLTVEPLTVSGGDLFVGTGGNGVFRWNEGDAQWEAAGLENRVVFCLTDTPDGLMAGAQGELYITTNGGANWTLEYDGIKPWLSVRAIAAGDEYYYAGLDGGGVYRAAFSGAVDALPPIGQGPQLLVQPNPALAGGQISFRIASAAQVDLAVFDAAGRRVADLSSDRFAAGAHAIAWDGKGRDGVPLAAGVYMVRLRAGGEQWTSKEIRVR